jgi:uncharacterized protein
MTSTLTIRLEDRMHAELGRLARAQGTTLSELARRTLGALLVRQRVDDLSDRPGSVEIPAGLTTVERHQLALLHRILARLVEGDGEDGDFDYQITRAEILQSGYVAEYDDVFVAIEPELSRRETGLVMDILDMFTQLEWSYSRLSEPERESLGGWAEHAVLFDGFDLNHRLESRLLMFARHLIEQGKWQQLTAYFDDQHERGNSHHPTIDAYERMLEEFNPIWRDKVRAATTGGSGSFELTADEIRRVTDAKIHPDNRK